MDDRIYIAIDLKSFYASVECHERGLDPMTTNLVVADEGRTEKTICLAVSPSLKVFGISGRPRLFEVEQKIKEVNANRQRNTKYQRLTGTSSDYTELMNDPNLAVSYLVATPRMAHYIEYSARIYEVYLKYIAPEDIHVYSIDEVFIDATTYLKMYRMTAYDLATRLIHDVLKTTGITATAGIGTNLYLSKVAMDIVAKKCPADSFGVRIAELNEQTYRRLLWNHQPLTSFWRIGKGYAKKLEAHGMYTMGDVARMSLSKSGEHLLYQLFGVNAELVIDHAWGYESCTMEAIKAYQPENSSMSSGQVLPHGYSVDQARLVVREMTDSLVLELVEKKLVTSQIVLTIDYDRACLVNSKHSKEAINDITTDAYGRTIPKPSRGSKRLESHTSSTTALMQAITALYDDIVQPKRLVRRLTIAFHQLKEETMIKNTPTIKQLDLFTDYKVVEKKKQQETVARKKERQKQEALLQIRKKFGKNSILKGMNLEEGATTRERNNQIGGHKA